MTIFKPLRFGVLILGLIISFSAFSQPDLVIDPIVSILGNNFKKGEIMNLSFRVKNTGTQTATTSFVALYYSTSSLFDANAVFLCRVSTENLTPNSSSILTQLNYSIPQNIASGSFYLYLYTDVFQTITESNELNNIYRLTNPIAINSTIVQTTKIPYPIIFIHGLNSQDTAWYEMERNLSYFHGLIYGGSMNFCLNYDMNLNNGRFSTDYKDFTASTNKLLKGDYYNINFNVDQYNNPYSNAGQVQSNQSAVFKQGRAVRDAIKYVLQKTGRDKVILVGHSMGGLASREYLSNSSIWQSDNKHHVAKLYTIATPHGGSNATSFGASGFFNGLDESSEAVRDLRTTYYYSFNQGAYVFGGTESNSYMWDRLLFNFYNVDVNCDGITGQYVTGLNSKYSPNDIYYSCSIGYKSGANDDGVVSNTSANMNYYLSFQPPLASFYADTFAISGPSPLLNPLHSQMPNGIYFYINAKGLDEPYNSDLSYNISFDSLYYGTLTYPSLALAQYMTRDVDAYKVTTTLHGDLRIKISNIPVNDFIYAVTNISQTNTIRVFTGGKGSIDTTMKNIPPDDYYFFVSGAPTPNSLYFPYSYKLSFTPVTSIVQQPISQTVCGGNFATFSVSVTGIGPFSYNWSNGNTNNSLTTSVLGNYFVTVSGLNGTVVSNVATLQNLNCITVLAPVIIKQPTSQTVCGGTFATFTVSVSGQGSMFYKWSNGSTNSSLVTSTPGIYFVTVTGVNGNVISNTATLTSKNCTVTQINPIDISKLEVNVYPNPTEDELTVFISNLGNENAIELFNELGISVLSIKSSKPSQKLNLSNLSKGFYILSVQIDNQFRKIKILKE